MTPKRTHKARAAVGGGHSPPVRICRSFCILGLLAALALVCPAVQASITGSISGVVQDPSGAVIPNGEVTVVNIATHVAHTTHADNAGVYSFLALPVGRYRMEVKAQGFKAYEQTDITLDASDALRFDVVLQLGQVTQSVEVSTSAVHVERVNTQMGDVISGSKMENLPLNGRSYLDLLGLQPGVVPVATHGSGTLAGGTSTSYLGSSQTGNMSISGQREASNGFEVNGGNVEETRNNGAGVVPNLDSIAEFRVLTNNADAEYGHYNGGLISVVTKSGTNDWHGSAFEFLRNEKMDSRNFFELNQTNPVTGQELPGTARGEFRRNQFGGTFDGRIKRNKAFFFGDYEGKREIVGTSSGLIPVLTQAERNGDFSANAANLLTSVVGGGLASPFFAGVLSQRLGYTVTSGEPYYTPGCTNSSQCAFPNGIVPTSAYSQAAAGLLQFIPLPNVLTPQGAFFISSANNIRTNDDKSSGRVDVNSGWGTITAYYYFERINQLKPFGDNPVPGFPSQNAGRIQQINLSDTKAFGGTAVNEIRFSLLRFVNRSDQPTQGLGVKLSTFGFGEGVPGGFISADATTEGVPAIAIVGGPTIGVPGIVYDRFQTSPQVRDIFSKVKGTHTLKFGGEYHFTNFVQKFPIVGGNGFITFTGSETGSGFTDYLIGAPSGFTEGSPDDFDERKNYAGLFAQDSWRARPNLTINYGLRWDLVQPWYERFNERNTFIVGGQSTVFPGAPPGDLFPGDPLPGGGKLTRSIAKFPKNNFGPRIGIAYSPSPSGGFWQRVLGSPGKTSLRASYGIYYTNIEGAQTFNTDPEPPYIVFYTSPVPPLLELPRVNRTNGAINPIPLPFTLPHPGDRIDFTPFLPLNGDNVISKDNLTPYTEHFSFSLQRQFGANTLLTLAYVGNQGHRLATTLPVNPGNPQLCLSLAGCGPFGENGVYTAPDGTIVYGTRAPFGINLSDNAYVSTVANSNYNALEFEVRRTLGRFSFLAGYTYGKSLDNSSAYNDQSGNPFNQRLTRSLSGFDVTHNFVISYSCLLPFDKLASNRWPRLSGGWTLVGITHFTTGFPVTVIEVDDRSLLGTGGAFIGTALDEPDFVGGSLHFNDPRTGRPFFDPSLFALEPLGRLGTANRRFFHGPGLNNFDMGLLKDVKVTERVTLQFRGEFFNVFNHAQFNNPDGNINDLPPPAGTFGLVTSARDARIGQIAIKVLF